MQAVVRGATGEVTGDAKTMYIKYATVHSFDEFRALLAL
jgi:hypothetical protein